MQCGRLWRMTASTPERWKAAPVELQRRDPVGVWFRSELEGGTAVVGTTSGEVIALPNVSRSRHRCQKRRSA